MSIIDTIEQHPVIASVVVGVIGLGLTVYFVSRNSQNTATGIPTDAAGNPLTPGLNVSPTLSSSDLQGMMQDLENQILAWENQVQGQLTTGDGTTTPPASVITPKDANLNLDMFYSKLKKQFNLGNITEQDIWAANPSINPMNIAGGTTINIPTTAPTKWWQNILHSFGGSGQGSYYTTPQNETLQQLANLFGLGPNGWIGLYYNGANNTATGLNLKALAQKQGLSGTSGKQANLVVPAGTQVWITTSGIEVG